MRKPRSIPFTEFTRLLTGLGYKLKRTERAMIFHHPSEGLIVVRVYDDAERMDQRDLQSSRKYLDLRGIIEEDDFDRRIRMVASPTNDRGR